MTHDVPDDPGPVAETPVDHGESGSAVPPWMLWVVLAIVAVGVFLLVQL